MHRITPKQNVHSTIENILRLWHRRLALTRQTKSSWHRDRLREELKERRHAGSYWKRLSETSDVLFSISRARHDGHPIRALPPVLSPCYFPAYGYMLAKFSSRWMFYRTAAALCKAPHVGRVCEVVNPSKDEKLVVVACRHQIDPVLFKRVAGRLRRVWPLLP
jgi:hypothetical protein